MGSIYDDMNVVIVSPDLFRTKGTTLNAAKIYNCSKNLLKKFIDTTRLWLLFYLLICPTSAGPLLRPSKYSRRTPITVPLRHSHREHSKVRNDIDQQSILEVIQEPTVQSRVYFDIPKIHPSTNRLQSLPQQQSSSHKSLTFSQKLLNLRQERFPHLNFEENTLPSLKSTSSNLLSSEVPKLSGSSPYSASVGVSTVETRVHRQQKSSFRVSMDETDDTGRERRATASSGAGGGHWMKPCPNLDSKLDETATPHSLSMLILRAIHEAKSQVDKFINDFAREAFQVDSWQESLTEHGEFSLSFLNNSSGLNLNSPEAIPFSLALQEAYELMQRRAVGIEQVTLDQALYQASFLTEFRHVEDRIVHVLCELRYAMIQSGVNPKEDVTKDVMEEKARDMDGERRRNIRDAVILREYVTGLQVLHALFNNYASDSQ